MSSSAEKTSGIKESTMVKKTKAFLLKSAEMLKTDGELSRDLIHSRIDLISDLDLFKNRACKKCGTLRGSLNTTYRIKPKKKFSKSVQKAMKDRGTRHTNSKKMKRTLNRFVNSTSTLSIRCKLCSFVEKIPTASRTDICTIRSKAKQANKAKQTPVPSPAVVRIRTSTPSGKRRSVESFINDSLNSGRNSTSSTPRSKKKRASHLSQLLVNESSSSQSNGLMDFLSNL